jgi:hypothetical protein
MPKEGKEVNLKAKEKSQSHAFDFGTFSHMNSL